MVNLSTMEVINRGSVGWKKCSKNCSIARVRWAEKSTAQFALLLRKFGKISKNPGHASSQPTFLRLINVFQTLWISVEITLIRCWNWNKIQRRIFNIAQRWYNVGVRRWNNVDTTLSCRCFKMVSTLVKAISKPVRLAISSNLWKDNQVLFCLIFFTRY